MKNAIALFIKEHPYMSLFIVTTVCSEARNTIVGVARAITGKYPPEREAAMPKVDISVKKPESDVEPDTTILEGDVTETEPDQE